MIRSVQVPLFWQGWAAHSSISVIMNVESFFHYEIWLEISYRIPQITLPPTYDWPFRNIIQSITTNVFTNEEITVEQNISTKIFIMYLRVIGGI